MVVDDFVRFPVHDQSVEGSQRVEGSTVGRTVEVSELPLLCGRVEESEVSDTSTVLFVEGDA